MSRNRMMDIHSRKFFNNEESVTRAQCDKISSLFCTRCLILFVDNLK